MAGITVTREAVAALLGADVTEAQWAAAAARVRSVLRSACPVDVDLVEGSAQDTVDNVFTSVVLRVLSNPLGLATALLGGAQLGYGAARLPLELTAGERAELGSLRPPGPRRPTYAVLRPRDVSLRLERP